MGLDGSLTEAKRWVKSGQTLLSATPHEIDKELNIKVLIIYCLFINLIIIYFFFKKVQFLECLAS